MIGNVGSEDKQKKKELFKSNVEVPASTNTFSGVYFGFNQNLNSSHKDFLNDSIKSSSNDDESVAEERN